MVHSEGKNKKMLITKRKDFEMLRKITTREIFNEKFELSMELVSRITAEEAIINLNLEDSRMLTTEEKLFLIKNNML